jgi:hypothetical protein
VRFYIYNGKSAFVDISQLSALFNLSYQLSLLSFLSSPSSIQSAAADHSVGSHNRSLVACLLHQTCGLLSRSESSRVSAAADVPRLAPPTSPPAPSSNTSPHQQNDTQPAQCSKIHPITHSTLLEGVQHL